MASPTAVCQYYLRNKCVYGDHCIHYHPKLDSTPAAPTTPDQRAICSFYLAGKCSFGDSCKRAHLQTAHAIRPLQPPVLARRDPGEQSWRKPVAIAATSSTMECLYFQRGRCRNGSTCPMSHAVPTTQSAAPAAVTASPAFGPCRYFLLGTCTKGSSCPYKHPVTIKSPSIEHPGAIQPLTPARVTETKVAKVQVSNVAEKAQVDSNVECWNTSAPCTRQFYKCAVRFNADAVVEDVQTAFESCRLIFKNLPHSVLEGDLITLVSPYGTIERVSIRIGPSNSTATVELVSWKEAEKAALELRNAEVRGKKVTAQLDLASGQRDQASLRSTKVRVSWYAPSTVAWAHYGTVSTARKYAEQLNGSTFAGATLQATFQRPSMRQTRSFSIVIKGFPASSSKLNLQRFCGAESLDVRVPERTAWNAQEHVVSNLLAEHGVLEQWEVVTPAHAAGKVVAFAHFDDAANAESAARALNSRKQPQLGNSPLWVEVIHSIKYAVPRSQFVVMQQAFERVAAVHSPCKLKWYADDADGRPVDPVIVRAYCSDAKELGRLKHEMDDLVAGLVLCSDGKVLWADFFITDDGTAYLSSIQQRFAVDIKVDPRVRKLRMFGNVDLQGEIETQVQQKLTLLTQQWKIISLESGALRTVLTNLSTFGASFTEVNLSVDIMKRHIRVRGSDDEVRKLQRELEALVSQSQGLTSDGSTVEDAGDDCPVCFCPVDDKVELPCGHGYCRGCMKELLSSAASQDLPSLHCLRLVNDSTCSSAIPLSCLHDVLSPDAEDALLKRLFLAFINTRPADFHYCPSPDCAVVYRRGLSGTVLTCPACLARICPACCVGFHEGLSCAEHRDNVSGGYRALQKWREENGVKPCPTCGVDIQKSEGCNHMTCVRCGTHMCWVCLKVFGGQGGQGVYDHMNREHGGIGVLGY